MIRRLGIGVGCHWVELGKVSPAHLVLLLLLFLLLLGKLLTFSLKVPCWSRIKVLQSVARELRRILRGYTELVSFVPDNRLIFAAERAEWLLY